MAHTYILKSLKDGGFYYGSTDDIERRLRDHNAGKVRSTKSRRPFVLHYQEHHTDRTAALQRERFFKSIDGYRWLKEQGIIGQTTTGELAERLLHRS